MPTFPGVQQISKLSFFLLVAMDLTRFDEDPLKWKEKMGPGSSVKRAQTQHAFQPLIKKLEKG